MSTDYLWDKTGEPDPEVERLEGLLSPFQHGEQLRMESRRSMHLGAVAAALVVIGFASWMLTQSPSAGWDMEGGGRLRAGQWLETKSPVQLKVGEIGELDVAADTRLKIVRAGGDGEHRIAVARGEIEAFIWAPPRKFFVDTPSAIAVDLGCRYTLRVEPSGAGHLEVKMGWVAFEANGRESFIPAGAACETRRETGPGTPYYLDASEALRSALKRYDRGDASALAAVLAEARPRDAVTLWHLLPRVPSEIRPSVYATMAALAPPPEGVTREGVIALKRQMLDQWWDSLGLDSADWWRRWKGDWRQ